MTTRVSALFLVVLLAVDCGPTQVTPSWRQSRSDISGTGSLLVGTRPAQTTGEQSAFPIQVGLASPVIAPNGNVYISTWDNGGGTPIGQGQLVRLSGNGAPVVTKMIPKFSGQLSTPAIDSNGSVYVTEFISFNGGIGSSWIFKFDPDLNQLTAPTAIQGSAISAPRILEVNNDRIILQMYEGYNGTHLLLLNDKLQGLADWETCHVDDGSLLDNFRISFQVRGIDLGAPYPEFATVAVRSVAVGDGGRPQFFVMAAGGGCGITFYQLDPTGANPKYLTFIKQINPGAALYSQPAISAEGIAVIADSNKHVTAYDVPTGNQKWQFTSDSFVAGAPAMLPTAIGVVYVTSYDHAVKVDLNSGQVLNSTALAGVSFGSSVDASPAVSGRHLFVSTSSGVLTYDLMDLKLLAFAPFAGGASSPAIGPNGDVVVAGKDGTVARFQ